jgi:hypothetical protein
VRGCLILVLGFLLGLAISIFFVARPPTGTATPTASDVRITISDGYLARRIQQKISSLGMAEVSGVSVASAPPSELIAHGRVAAGPLSEPVTLGLQPVAASGTVQVRIISTQVGGLPVPSVFTTLVANVINQAITRSIGNQVRIVGTAVTGQGLVISADYP